MIRHAIRRAILAATCTGGVLATGCAVLPTPAPTLPPDAIEVVVQRASYTAGEPYGGCDEAYLYPGTEGARWCTFRSFGKRWTQVGQPLADALAESGAPRADTRRWERCAVRTGARRYLVVCPDGTVLVWRNTGA